MAHLVPQGNPDFFDHLFGGGATLYNGLAVNYYSVRQDRPHAFTFRQGYPGVEAKQGALFFQKL
jgi:hypothetical protein